MKLFVVLFAIVVSSCALFRSNPAQMDPRGIRLSEATQMVKDLMMESTLPWFVEREPTGLIIVDETILTEDTALGIVKVSASNRNGHLADLYFIVVCLDKCTFFDIIPITDPLADSRKTSKW